MTDPRLLISVIDDDESVRESLPDLLKELGFTARAFSSAEEFLESDTVLRTECLILDLAELDSPRRPRCPDVQIRARIPCASSYIRTKLYGLGRFSSRPEWPRIAETRFGWTVDMPIIFITGHGDIPMTVQAMKAGAVEFLTKPFADHVLLNAIRNAVDRSRAVIARDEALRSLKERYAQLIPREREVMALVVVGLLNKQIAGELRISEITVKAHRGCMMRKMNADSLAELVNMDARLRLPRVACG
jgi:FixJ family two-component response regulator